MSTENLGPKTRRRRRWQNNRYLYNNFGKESESSQVGNKVLELPNSVMGELKYVHEILRKSERSRSIVENNNSQAEKPSIETSFGDNKSVFESEPTINNKQIPKNSTQNSTSTFTNPLSISRSINNYPSFPSRNIVLRTPDSDIDDAFAKPKENPIIQIETQNSINSLLETEGEENNNISQPAQENIPWSARKSSSFRKPLSERPEVKIRRNPSSKRTDRSEETIGKKSSVSRRGSNENVSLVEDSSEKSVEVANNSLDKQEDTEQFDNHENLPNEEEEEDDNNENLVMNEKEQLKMDLLYYEDPNLKKHRTIALQNQKDQIEDSLNQAIESAENIQKINKDPSILIATTTSPSIDQQSTKDADDSGVDNNLHSKTDDVKSIVSDKNEENLKLKNQAPTSKIAQAAENLRKKQEEHTKPVKKEPELSESERLWKSFEDDLLRDLKKLDMKISCGYDFSDLQSTKLFDKFSGAAKSKASVQQISDLPGPPPSIPLNPPAPPGAPPGPPGPPSAPPSAPPILPPVLPSLKQVMAHGLGHKNSPPVPAAPPPAPILNQQTKKVEQIETQEESSFSNKQTKTVKLRWREINSQKINEKSFWQELKSAKEQSQEVDSDDQENLMAGIKLNLIDISKLDQAFEDKSKDNEGTSGKGKGYGKNSNQQNIIKVFDDRRSRAIDIARNRLPKAEAIKAAIQKMDSRALPKDSIQILVNLLPSDEELELIREKKHDAPRGAVLREAEQFIESISAIPDVQAWLKLWDFKLDFEDQVKKVADPLTDLKDAIYELQTSKLFRQILVILLEIGSYLNEKNVKAIELSFLSRVAEIKDTNKRQTLLYHIVSIIIENNLFPDHDLYSEFASVSRSARTDFKEMDRSLEMLEKKCKLSWDMIREISKSVCSNIKARDTLRVMSLIEFRLIFCYQKGFRNRRNWRRGGGGAGGNN